MALIDRGCRFIVSVKYYDYVHPSHCHLDSPLGLAEEHEALRSHASKTVEEFLEMAQQTPVGYPKHFMEWWAMLRWDFEHSITNNYAMGP